MKIWTGQLDFIIEKAKLMLEYAICCIVALEVITKFSNICETRELV